MFFSMKMEDSFSDIKSPFRVKIGPQTVLNLVLIYDVEKEAKDKWELDRKFRNNHFIFLKTFVCP